MTCSCTLASPAALFGAASSAAASPFSFTTPQPAQSQPSLFGAAPASTPSLFGGASAPAAGAAPFGSLFGQSSAAAAGGALAPYAGATAAPAAPDMSAIRELESIKDSFVPAPNNPRYRFQALLLNVVDNPAARVKPAGVDELRWRAALQQAGGPDNPDHLWPVQAQGFKDLLARWAPAPLRILPVLLLSSLFFCLCVCGGPCRAAEEGLVGGGWES
jgi:nuclear pore complex protein Nup54